MAPLSWQVHAADEAASAELAQHIATRVAPGTVIALVGPLGAGKTTFVRAFAAALQVFEPAEVASPTYTLVNVYPAPGAALVHLDFYRLDGVESAYALGLEEEIHRPEALVVVEWADKFPELLPQHAIWCTFAFAADGGRNIHVTGVAAPAGASPV